MTMIDIKLLERISKTSARELNISDEDFEISWDILELNGCIGKRFKFSQSEDSIGHTIFGPETIPTLQAVIIALVSKFLWEIAKFGYEKLREKITNSPDLEAELANDLGIKTENYLNFGEVTQNIIINIEKYVEGTSDPKKNRENNINLQ